MEVTTCNYLKVPIYCNGIFIQSYYSMHTCVHLLRLDRMNNNQDFFETFFTSMKDYFGNNDYGN